MSQKPPPLRQKSVGNLIPTLGLFSTLMLVVGGVIGSGIFRKTGVMDESIRFVDLGS